MTQKIGLELDLAWDSDIPAFLESLPKPIKIINVQAIGPGGGNPCFEFECDNIDHAYKIWQSYDPDGMFDYDEFENQTFPIG